jgi:mannose-6-phosphate isomerase
LLAVDLLENQVHSDAWGSLTAIPRLLGEEPDGEPRSELWMGAHPSASSRLTRNGATRTLLDLIESDPEAELGAAVVAAYGARLPYLLKVLAAARPLSLQAHPNAGDAATGYAAEEERGIDRADPARSYPDPSHKPEMICALTEFDALCGFAPVDETIAWLEALDVSALATDRESLRSHPDASGLRIVLARLLHLTAAERAPIVAAVAARCAELAADDGRAGHLARTVVDLAELHPGDVGVLCALFMNRVTLRPGEAIFLQAGNLHAYLAGLGVEIMASSDNVLRAGLTARHIDVEGLLAVVDTTPGPVPVVAPTRRSDIEAVYPVPVPDFELTRLTLRAGQAYEIRPGLPRILLVVEGELQVTQDGRTERLQSGGAGFFAAASPSAVLSGTTTAFLASTSTPGETPAADPAR